MNEASEDNVARVCIDDSQGRLVVSSGHFGGLLIRGT